MARKPDEGRMAPPVDSDEHKKKLQHALGRLTAAEERHNTLVPVWLENYRAFKAQATSATPTDKASWQSDVKSPYVAEQVLTMLPRMVEGKPSVDILRQDPATPAAVARAQRHWMTNNLHLDSFPQKAARLALHTILFGAGWSKQSYLYEYVNRDVLNRQTGLREDTRIVTADRPTTSIPHPIDVLPDPSAQVLETARFVILRTMSTVGQVKAKERRKVRRRGPDGTERDVWVGMYSNTDEVKAWGRGEDFQRPDGDVPSYVSSRAGGGRVEVLELLDKELDRVITVVNRQIVVRDQRMPWWHGQLPVALAVATPDVSSLQGISEVDWIRPMQEMLWLLENQRLDNTRLQMDMVMLVRDTLMDIDDYALAPGEKWPVQQMDDVQFLQYPQPQLASFQDIESIRGRLQAIIGSAFMTGGDSSSMGVNQETASGLMSIIEEGNRRVDFRMNMMAMCYERILMQHLSDGAQFLEDAMFVPGAKRGSDPIPVSPDTLGAKAWVRVSLGSDTGLKSLRQQMAQGLIMASAQFQGVPLPTPEGVMQFNNTPILEVLADAYDRDPEEFMFDPQAMAQIQQAQAPMAPVAAGADAAAGNPTQVAMGGGAPAAPAGLPVGAVEGA